MEIKELNLKNKVALITGGAGGFGSATAKLFKHNGCTVYITDINTKKLDLINLQLKKIKYIIKLNNED